MAMAFQENGALWKIAPNDLRSDLVDQVNQRLIEFAQSSHFDSVLARSFGTQEKTDTLQEVLASGTFFDGIAIEVLPSATLQGALGGYATANNTIYLSEELLESSLEAATAVLLEEMGHAIDAQINDTDSAGDEGAIFSALVRGKTLTQEELNSLSQENDFKTITVDGELVTVEQSLYPPYTEGDNDNNELKGQAGNDTLNGYGGDDILEGSEGRDTLNGGSGDDILLLDDEGPDLLRGGEDNDTYVIEFNDIGFLGGSQIEDISGDNDSLYIVEDYWKEEINPGYWEQNSSVLVLGFESGFFGIEAQDNNLALDLNRDGDFNINEDLVIVDFYQTQEDGSITIGSGYIENITTTYPLKIELDQGEFEDADGDGDYKAEGTIYIGRDDGIARMLRIVGTTAEYDDTSLTINGGTVYSEISGVTAPLFTIQDSIEIPFANPIATVSENRNSEGQFQLAGLDIGFNSLTLQPNNFRLGGQFTLPEELTGLPLDVSLSQPDTLVFEQNQVRLGSSNSLKLPDTEFSLFNLVDVTSSDLGIAYEAPTDTIKLQGKFTLDSFAKDTFVESVTADLSGENFIKITNGKPDITGSLIVETDLKTRKGWGLSEIKLNIDTTNKDVGGSAELTFPFKAKIPEVTFELGFKTSIPPLELNEVVVDVDNLHLPIPKFPLVFFQRFVGGVENFAPSDPDPTEYIGGLGLTVGPQVFGSSLLRLDLDGKINEERLEGTGKVVLINKKILTTIGKTTLNWNKKSIKQEGSSSLLDGLIKTSAGYELNSNFDISTNGVARISIPSFLPYGGTDVSEAQFSLQFTNDNDNDLSNDFAEAWWSIFNPLSFLPNQPEKLTVGFRGFFDGDFEFFGAKEVPIVGSWDVVADAEYLLVNANWENATNSAVPVQVIDNNGNVIPESEFAANNIAVVEDLSNETNKTVIIANPAAGIWDVEVLDDTGLGEVNYFASRDSEAPTVEIINPATDVSGGEVTIDYEAFDADSEAQVTLFYDTDNEGFDGLQIVDGLVEEDGAGSFVWNTQGVTIGEYYIYAMIRDENNPAAFDYSTGKVQITEAADLSVTQTVDVPSVDIGEAQTYTVEVTNNGADTSQGVSLNYTLPDGATFVSATVTPSEQSDNNLIFDLGNLENGAITTVQITANASALVGNSDSEALVTSNTYDPNANNDVASLTTTVTNSQSLLELSIDDISLPESNEGITNFTFTVSLPEASTETITVNYATEDLSAISEADYTAASGTLEFAPGETEKTITVKVLGDTDIEPDETFLINISNPSNAAIADNQAIATIADNDEADTPTSLVFGTLEDDTLEAGLNFDGEANLVFTGEGNDDILAQLAIGGNRLYSGSGNDELFAGTRDRLFGGAGDDTLDASVGGGDNRLFGGAGDDDLFLGAEDRLNGGEGDDRFFTLAGGDNVITGGSGADQFWIANAEIPSSANVITDFTSGEDTIGLGGFPDLTFAEITLTQEDSNTIISLGADTELVDDNTPLAELLGIETNTLTENDFTLAAVTPF